MKTLKELYSEVLKDEELKKAFAEATRNNTVEDFLQAHDCGASTEELSAFLKERQAKAGELADDELDNVAGGCNPEEALFSVATFGVGCTAVAIESAKMEENHIGEDGRLLC